MDWLVKALSARTRIRVTLVDVTHTAKTLEARHLCGPVSGRILAEGIAVSALLSADRASEDEAILVQARVDGPVKGVTVETTGAGDVRGYPTIKVLGEWDGQTPVRSETGLGRSGSALIQRSLPGKLLAQTPMPFTPPDFRLLLARYYHTSLQVPAGVELAVSSDSGGVIGARGLVVERMPDGKQADFVPVLEALEECRVRKMLAADASIPAMGAVFGLADLEAVETRELRFRCRCSREKALASMATLSAPEIDAIASEGRPRHVVCHMCGADYLLSAAEIAR